MSKKHRKKLPSQIEAWKSLRGEPLPPNKTEEPAKGGGYRRHQKHRKGYSPFDDSESYHESFA